MENKFTDLLKAITGQQFEVSGGSEINLSPILEKIKEDYRSELIDEEQAELAIELLNCAGNLGVQFFVPKFEPIDAEYSIRTSDSSVPVVWEGKS